LSDTADDQFVADLGSGTDTLKIDVTGGWTATTPNSTLGPTGVAAGISVAGMTAYTFTDGTNSVTVFTNAETVQQLSSAPALFTTGDDIVNFSQVVAGSYAPGSQYDALAGNDTVTLPIDAAAATAAGYNAAQTFNGGDGNDVINGGTLNDIIAGGNGNDIVQGGAGDDTLTGGNNSDKLDGGSGNDNLNGNGSADTLIGGLGDDLLDGGPPATIPSVPIQSVRHTPLVDDADRLTHFGGIDSLPRRSIMDSVRWGIFPRCSARKKIPRERKIERE
jgi:Ca2+-binding RTX toxin-like protein